LPPPSYQPFSIDLEKQKRFKAIFASDVEDSEREDEDEGGEGESAEAGENANGAGAVVVETEKEMEMESGPFKLVFVIRSEVMDGGEEERQKGKEGEERQEGEGEGKEGKEGKTIEETQTREIHPRFL
jgi:hypothetical protein